MSDEKKYRECMAEIVAVLQKYDMAAAITVISQERAMFRYQFPTWSCISLEGEHVRFRAKSGEFPSKEAQQQSVNLSAHIVYQMRDISAQTFSMCEAIIKELEKKFHITHESYADFDPEHEQ